MLDFMYMRSAELFGTGREQKFPMKYIYMSPAGFEPTPRAPRQVTRQFRPLCHDCLTMIKSYVQASGIQIDKTITWQHVSN